MSSTLHVFSILIVIAFLSSCQGKEESSDNTEPVDTLQNILLQAQKCSRLYTTEFHIHKIVSYDEQVRVKGKLFNQDYNIKLPIGYRKIAFPMDATLKGYIDMGQLTEENFIREGDRLTIMLPNPQIMMTATKIDQHNVKEYISLTRAHFSDREITHLERQGRKAIISNVARYGIAEQARENAARLLIPIVTKMGFEEQNVTITFSDELTPESLQRIITTNTPEI